MGLTHSLSYTEGAREWGGGLLGCKSDGSAPSSAGIYNTWSFKSTPPIRLHGRGFTLPLPYLPNTIITTHLSGTLSQ